MSRNMIARSVLAVAALVIAVLAGLELSGRGLWTLFQGRPGISVLPYAESVAAQEQGDAADDAEIWRNPAAPEKSLIFATDKKAGLMVLDLQGQRVAFFPTGRMNNVDLRDWPAFGGVLVAASDRTRKGITLFRLDPKTLETVHLVNAFIATDLDDPYGLCLYRPPGKDVLNAFVIGKDGEVRQFALVLNGAGQINAKELRRFAVGSIAEGCVVDDRTGALYIAEEMVGIWRYEADASSGSTRVAIAKADATDLVPDLEGLTLAPEGTDGGYLVASIQGNSTFALFQLPEAKLVARIAIRAHADRNIDEVTGTDGVAVATGDFGPGRTKGLMVVQDDENPGAAQNFKLISWDDVLASVARK